MDFVLRSREIREKGFLTVCAACKTATKTSVSVLTMGMALAPVVSLVRVTFECKKCGSKGVIQKG